MCSERSIPSISSINRILRDRNLFGPGPLSPELKLKLEASLMRSTSSDDDDCQRSDAGDGDLPVAYNDKPASDADHNVSHQIEGERIRDGGEDEDGDGDGELDVSASADCFSSSPPLPSLLFASRTRAAFQPHEQHSSECAESSSSTSSPVGLERHVSAPPPDTSTATERENESEAAHVSSSVPCSPAPTPTPTRSATQTKASVAAGQLCAPMSTRLLEMQMEDAAGANEATWRPTSGRQVDEDCLQEGHRDALKSQIFSTNEQNQPSSLHQTQCSSPCAQVKLEQHMITAGSCSSEFREVERTDSVPTAAASTEIEVAGVAGVSATPECRQEACSAADASVPVPVSTRGVIRRLMAAARGLLSSEDSMPTPTKSVASAASRAPHAFLNHSRRGSRKRSFRMSGLLLSTPHETRSQSSAAKRTATSATHAAESVPENREARDLDGPLDCVSLSPPNSNQNALSTASKADAEAEVSAHSAYSRTQYLLLGGLKFTMRRLATNEWALDAPTLLHASQHPSPSSNSPPSAHSWPAAT